MPTIRIFTLQPQNNTRHRECSICGHIFKIADKIIAKIQSRGTKTKY